MSKFYNVYGVSLNAKRVTFTGGTYTPSSSCFGFKADTEGSVVFTSGGETLTVQCFAGDTWACDVESITEAGTTASIVVFTT